MRKIALVFFISLVYVAPAQVSRNVLLEHFTNTNCSVCASRNPSFYNNVAAQGNGVVYLSIHPSAPYSSCLLSQQNKGDNDARTNYYGIYGATPRLAIQGSVVSSGANYGNSAIFTPYKNQVSPFDIRISQQKDGDSVSVRVVVVTASAHTFDSLRLFAGLAEDTVFYQGGNGEKQHYHVLRKTLYGALGAVFSPAKNTGDSVVFQIAVPMAAFWIQPRIYSVAFLQDPTDKQVWQAAATTAGGEQVITGVRSLTRAIAVNVYPNPASDLISVEAPEGGEYQMSLYSPNGQLLQTQLFSGVVGVNVSGLPRGLYLVKITGRSYAGSAKVVLD